MENQENNQTLANSKSYNLAEAVTLKDQANKLI